MDMVGVAVLAADVAGAVVKTTVVGNPTDLLYFYPTLFLGSSSLSPLPMRWPYESATVW